MGSWFGFFISWHINLCRLFNAKSILLEEQYWYYLTHSLEDKGVHTFPNGICPKVNSGLYLNATLHIKERSHSSIKDFDQ